MQIPIQFHLVTIYPFIVAILILIVLVLLIPILFKVNKLLDITIQNKELEINNKKND